jgi:HD-GYP domain-containing protein (c-di-GMP phosphodiesterase class II)
VSQQDRVADPAGLPMSTLVRTSGSVSRPRLSTRSYVLVVALAAVASLGLPPAWSASPERWAAPALILTILSALLEFEEVPLPRGGQLSVATIGHIALILLVSAPYAALCVGASVAIEQGIRRRDRARVAFNVSAFVLTASIASLAAGQFGSLRDLEAGGLGRHLEVFGALLAAMLAYYAVNIVLTAGVIARASDRAFLYVLRLNTRSTRASEFGAATIGGLLALIWVEDPLWTALLAFPAIVIALSLRYIRQLENETRLAVRSLADIVDRRDASTYDHSSRVAVYAVALARELALEDDLIDLVELVGGVHDLGKIAVPDAVLLKPGPLDPDERARMMTHAAIGQEVLAHYQLFRPGADIVRHHHENYDGTGYPDGLAGEAIPLGARVVAVADAFDAMTSARPYRPALSVEEAVSRLRAGAGTQWDPIVVGAFLRAQLAHRIKATPRPAGMHDHVADEAPPQALDEHVVPLRRRA